MVESRPYQEQELREELPSLKRSLQSFSRTKQMVNKAHFWTYFDLTRSDFTPASISTSLSLSSTPSSCITWRTDDNVETSSGCGSIAVFATSFSCFLSIWSNGVPGWVEAYRCRAVLDCLYGLIARLEGRRSCEWAVCACSRACKAPIVLVCRELTVGDLSNNRVQERVTPLRSILPIGLDLLR